MGDPESVDVIIASATEARRNLSDLEQQLQTEIDEIDFRAFQDGRPLTADEKARRKQFRASQTEVREAFVELAFVTLRRLDDSEEVKRLHKRMDQINRGLSDDLDDLKQIAEFAETAAKVADTIAEVVQKIAEKAAKVLV